MTVGTSRSAHKKSNNGHTRATLHDPLCRPVISRTLFSPSVQERFVVSFGAGACAFDIALDILPKRQPLRVGVLVELRGCRLALVSGSLRASLGTVPIETDRPSAVKALTTSPHLSLNREGRWDTTDVFKPVSSIFLCSPLPSWTWRTPARPVHSLMLSSNLFFRLPCRFPPFTLPCKMVLARPDERETSIPLQLASLYDGQAVSISSDCRLNLGTDFLVGNIVFV